MNVAFNGGNGAKRNYYPSGLHCNKIISLAMNNKSTDGRTVVASGNTLDVVIKVETVRIRVLDSVNHWG